jgi:hypothetical protein
MPTQTLLVVKTNQLNKRLLDDHKSIWYNFVYVFENNIPRCAPMSLLYVLFITDQNYSTVEKEWLAIVWSIESLKYYLSGHKFTVETDHDTGFDNKVDFNVWNELTEDSVHCKRMYLSKKEIF